MTSLIIRLFIPDYQDTSRFRVRESYGKVAGIVGICTNLLLAAVKLIAGIVFQSIAITADAVNNLTDSVSSIVTLIGFKLSAKPADARHPYGYARMEYISGLVVSVVILFLGFELGRSSLEKAISPQPTDFTWLVMGILAVSILVKVWQGLFYRKMGKAIQSTTLKAASTDSFNDVIATSVILIGGLITHFTGFNLDGYLGLGVAVFIMVSGVRLIIETANPLLGLAPSRQLIDRLRETILSYDGVLGFHDLKIHEYGEGNHFASVHCEVPAEQDVLVSHELIDTIERDVEQNLGVHLVIHMDPVVAEDERTTRLRLQVEGILLGISPVLSMHDFRVVWGGERTQVLFDVTAPFRFSLPDTQLEQRIISAVQSLDPAYHAVLVIDHEEEIPPAGRETLPEEENPKGADPEGPAPEKSNPEGPDASKTP